MSWDEPEALVLDLSDAEFLDVAALMMILGLAARRQAAGKHTQLRVPRRRRVRDFLRLWNFPDAVQTVTQIPFRQLVAAEDHAFFGEPQTSFRQSRPKEPALDTLVGSRFFGFISHRFAGDGGIDPEIVEREWRRWRDPLILEVFRTHLAGPGSDIARVIVYELLANVVQHPLATCVSTVSYVSGSYFRGQRRDTQLTLCVWDDGQTIYETLRSAASDAGTIRASTPDIPDRFAIKPVGWDASALQVSVDWTPALSSQDAEFVLASLFPGVTQKVAREVKTVARPESVPWETEIGFGLHALYRSVIDSFGGSVAIQSGSIFMNVRLNPRTRERGRVRYRAKVVAGARPTIRGNMITIRIPLKGGG